MTLLGNIIWIIFGGLFATLSYLIGGFVLCLTIIGIPFGLQSIKLGLAVFAPFGKRSQPNPNANNFLRLLFSLLWFITFGWITALIHLVFGVVLMITLIGIPFGLQHFKLIPISLMPFNYDLVDAQKHPSYIFNQNNQGRFK